MPRSQRPRRTYRGPQSQRDLAAWREEPASATPRARGKLLPITIGLGVAGAGAYAYNRSRKRNAVNKREWVMPTGEVVSFGKSRVGAFGVGIRRGFRDADKSIEDATRWNAPGQREGYAAGGILRRNRGTLAAIGGSAVGVEAINGSRANREILQQRRNRKRVQKSGHPPVALPVPRSTPVKALLPTGRHVADSANIEFKRRKRRKAGPSTTLQHFGKAAGMSLVSASQLSRAGRRLA